MHIFAWAQIATQILGWIRLFSQNSEEKKREENLTAGYHETLQANQHTRTHTHTSKATKFENVYNFEKRRQYFVLSSKTALWFLCHLFTVYYGYYTPWTSENNTAQKFNNSHQ